MTAISPTERLLAEIDGPLGWITFNNPERRNAVTDDMMDAFPVVLDRFEHDPAVRVVVIRGAGDKSFIAGGDTALLEQQNSSPEARAGYRATVDAIWNKLEHLCKPTVAMVRGHCIGFGFNVALQCDLRVAADDARFAMPAARIGNALSWNSVRRLIDKVGRPAATEFIFTARQFTAAEMAAAGLVNRMTTGAELESVTRSYCQAIAENAPLSLAAAKAMILAIDAPAGAAERRRADEFAARCRASEDSKEGLRALLEKRKPVFQGR